MVLLEVLMYFYYYIVWRLMKNISTELLVLHNFFQQKNLNRLHVFQTHLLVYMKDLLVQLVSSQIYYNPSRQNFLFLIFFNIICEHYFYMNSLELQAFVHCPYYTIKGTISTRFSSNSEAFTWELPDNLGEMLPILHSHNSWCVTRRKRVKNFTVYHRGNDEPL